MLFEKRLVVICVLLVFFKLTEAQDKGPQATNVQANGNSFLNMENLYNDTIVFERDDDSNISISERYCLEYNKNIFETVKAIPLTSGSKPINIVVTRCSSGELPLITVGGGRPALPGEFPFMGVLGYNVSDDQIRWLCGSILISDDYVMTAAHCVVTNFGRPVLVRLGELDLTKTDDNSFPEDFGITEFRVHPKYNSWSKLNDIALIKLNKTVKFNNFIRPTCLWNKDNIEHLSAIAIGWGASETGGRQSDILQKVPLDLVDKSFCDRTLSNNKYFENGIPRSMLCAGNLNGGKDTCYGDSGGPLVVTKKDNKCSFYTVGITSFGIRCGLKHTPAIYTRVSEYIPWIEEIVWQ